MNIEQLKNIINEYKDKFNLNSKTPWQFKSNQLLFKEINNKYPKLFANTMEVIYLIKNYNDLENLHIFCCCGNKNNFINSNKGFYKYCSHKCQTNSDEWQEKCNKTKLNNVDENGLNSYQRAGMNGKLTKLNDIDENGLNSFQRGAIKEKFNKLNNIDENGLNSYQRVEIKKKQVYLLKYGVNSFMSTNEFKVKSKQTKLKKYGNENYNNLEKCKQTKLKKYGNENYNNREKAVKTRLNDIDENGLNDYQRSTIKQKQTKLNDIDENGLNNYQRAAIKMRQTKLNDIDENGLNNFQRAHLKKLNNIDENGLNSFQRANIKCFETMKKNHTFNTSEAEEKIHESLLTKFKKEDIERQYRSKLYPFNCDFYIKSLDLYIEYHGTWTHFNKPFRNSIENIEQLNKWKNKNIKFYDNAIYTWTDLDVRKLETFKKNKLNHCIFYNLEQFYRWFNKI